jgi:hypothetical protein
MLTVAAGPFPLLRIWPVIRPRDRACFPGMIHTAGRKVPDMDTSAVVSVVCDRCHRPGWRLEVSPINGEVCVDGARISADDSRYWATFLGGPRAHRHRGGELERRGAFILSAYDLGDPAAWGDRHKLVCIGRKHGRYERVITSASAERAYHAAVAAGRARIRLSEI